MIKPLTETARTSLSALQSLYRKQSMQAKPQILYSEEHWEPFNDNLHVYQRESTTLTAQSKAVSPLEAKVSLGILL